MSSIKTTFIKSLCISSALASSILILSCNAIADPIASNPTDNQVVFYTQNQLAVPIDSDLYLQLLDDHLSQVKTSDFVVKRRLARTPFRQLPPQRGSHQPIGNNPLYTLCLDVFDLNGNFLGTHIHNLPVPH